MQMFIILMAIIGIESLLIVFMVWKTPVMTFLKAGLLKKSLIYIIGKDRMGKFKTFTGRNGAAQLGKDGLFHLTENSHTLETGSKIPIYFAFRDLAATLTPEYPAIIQEIREEGLIINHIEDVQDYIKKIKEGIKSDLNITVKPYKTYKFHDLENMFPNNIDPTFIDSTVQCEISKGLKTMKNAPLIYGGLAMLIAVIALAIYILNMTFKGSMSAADCQSMVEAAKCTWNGFAPMINNSAIIP